MRWAWKEWENSEVNEEGFLIHYHSAYISFFSVIILEFGGGSEMIEITEFFPN